MSIRALLCNPCCGEEKRQAKVTNTLKTRNLRALAGVERTARSLDPRQIVFRLEPHAAERRDRQRDVGPRRRLADPDTDLYRDQGGNPFLHGGDTRGDGGVCRNTHAEKILVERVRFLRFAEVRGRFAETVKLLNDFATEARASAAA